MLEYVVVIVRYIYRHSYQTLYLFGTTDLKFDGKIDVKTNEEIQLLKHI